MKACVIEGDFGIDNLKIVEREVPAVGPGQVRLGMRCASLNYRDLLMVQGKYNPRQPLPLVPVSDGVGVVEEVGAEVEGLAVGDRVVGLFAPQWHAGEPVREVMRVTRGGPLDGMLAEQVVSEASGVAKVPEYLTDEEAATLPCAALTAWTAVASFGRVGAADTVLVQGSGGVSSFALDFARMQGARVIATTSSEDKAAYLRERGADEIVRYDEDPAWGKTVRKLTGGRGVDHIVEVGGAGTLGQSLRAIRPGGMISLIGVLAGGAAKVDLTPVLMNNIRVQGILVGHTASFSAMTRALARTELRPRIDRTFPLVDAAAAFEHLQSGKHAGKVCIRVG